MTKEAEIIMGLRIVTGVSDSETVRMDVNRIVVFNLPAGSVRTLIMQEIKNPSLLQPGINFFINNPISSD